MGVGERAVRIHTSCLRWQVVANGKGGELGVGTGQCHTSVAVGGRAREKHKPVDNLRRNSLALPPPTPLASTLRTDTATRTTEDTVEGRYSQAAVRGASRT